MHDLLPHLALIKRILHYMKDTLNIGLHFSTGDVSSITTYSDND